MKIAQFEPAASRRIGPCEFPDTVSYDGRGVTHEGFGEVRGPSCFRTREDMLSVGGHNAESLQRVIEDISHKSAPAQSILRQLFLFEHRDRELGGDVRHGRGSHSTVFCGTRAICYGQNEGGAANYDAQRIGAVFSAPKMGGSRLRRCRDLPSPSVHWLLWVLRRDL